MKGDGWQIIVGDALLELSKLEAASVDAVATDPPYSSGGQFRGDRTASTRSKYTTEVDYGDFAGDTRDQRSYLAWCALWLAEAWRVARDGAIVATFIDWRMLPTMTDAIQAGGWVWRGIVPWHKVTSRRMLGRFAHSCEYVVWGSKGPIDAERGVGALGGHIECLPVHHTDRTHLTEKPVEVMLRVLEIVNPGGVVLDPFFGSGSTGEAALASGRSVIGIELAPGIAADADARLRALGGNTTRRAAAAGQLGLFAGAAAPEDDFGA